MKRSIIISPLSADTEEETAANERYAEQCMQHAFGLGEAPFASHLLYPRVLDDKRPEERKLGMAAGHAWVPCGHVAGCYLDRGMSDGMRDDVAEAVRWGVRVEFRSVYQVEPVSPREVGVEL